MFKSLEWDYSFVGQLYAGHFLGVEDQPNFQSMPGSRFLAKEG